MISDEMRAAALTCAICGKALEPAFRHSDEMGWLPQPSGGTLFYSHGQYGSTVYDEMHGDYLVITICDEDVLRLAAKGLVLERRQSHDPRPEPETSMWHPPLRWDADRGHVMWDDPGQQVST